MIPSPTALQQTLSDLIPTQVLITCKLPSIHINSVLLLLLCCPPHLIHSFSLYASQPPPPHILSYRHGICKTVITQSQLSRFLAHLPTTTSTAYPKVTCCYCIIKRAEYSVQPSISVRRSPPCLATIPLRQPTHKQQQPPPPTKLRFFCIEV